MLPEILIFVKITDESMNKKEKEKFKEIFEKFKKYLKNKDIKFVILRDNDDFLDSVSKTVKFSSRGLKKYTLGFWACGKWSNFYEVEDKSKVSIFIIHDWNMNKFRPSSADILFEIYVNETNDVDLEISVIADEIEKIKNNPIKTYYEICHYHRYNNPIIEYYSTLLSIFEYNTKDRIRYNISPIVLYNFLRFISLFDKRVKRRRVFSEDAIPRYTFSFLATKECSGNEESWQKFCDLYYRFPEWLKKKCRFNLFDAYWNVADYDNDMSEEEIKIRMKKGVVVDEK